MIVQSHKHDEPGSKPRTPESMPPRTVQPSLFEADDATRETRADAYKKSRPKQQRRRDAVELFVTSCGSDGATRAEIASALGVDDHCVSSPVVELIRSGRLVNTTRRRPTKTGCLAVVVVSALVASEVAS